MISVSTGKLKKTRLQSENRTTEIRRRQTHVNVIKVWPLNSKIYIFSILTYLLEFVGFETMVILDYKVVYWCAFCMENT